MKLSTTILLGSFLLVSGSSAAPPEVNGWGDHCKLTFSGMVAVQTLLIK
jgi:hypothetical protein